MAAWKHNDNEDVLRHVHDDIVWNNSGGFRTPLRGKAEMRRSLTQMAHGIEDTEWRLFDYAEIGNTVWMEGVDEFIGKNGTRKAIPYAGVLEFRDDLIVH